MYSAITNTLKKIINEIRNKNRDKITTTQKDLQAPLALENQCMSQTR